MEERLTSNFESTFVLLDISYIQSKLNELVSSYSVRLPTTNNTRAEITPPPRLFSAMLSWFTHHSKLSLSLKYMPTLQQVSASIVRLFKRKIHLNLDCLVEQVVANLALKKLRVD